MKVDISMHGIAGRHFYIDSRRRLDAQYERRPTIGSFPFRKQLPRAELLANPRQNALEALVELFKRVPNAPSLEIVRSWQGELQS